MNIFLKWKCFQCVLKWKEASIVPEVEMLPVCHLHGLKHSNQLPSLSELSADLQCQAGHEQIYGAGHQQIAKHSNQ